MPMPISLPMPNANLHTHFQRRYQSNPLPRNPRQTHNPTLIPTPHLNTNLCAKPQTPISTPQHWSAMRKRREIMSGWWLAMAGNSGSGHGVVAMEFWVWREGVSEDWNERENQRLRNGERDVRQRVGEVGLSTENRYPTHPKKPSDPAREPADSTPVTVGGGSSPPKPVTGGSVGGFSLPKSEKPEPTGENP